MLIPGHSLTIVWFLLDFVDCLTEHEKILEDTFRSRSDEDWASLWHLETHVRCRENIGRHLFWACEKDIYKLSRRQDAGEQETFPFLEMKRAKSLIRFRRNVFGRSSITNECCSSVGCTWEEYAEYCPFNKRIRKYRH